MTSYEAWLKKRSGTSFKGYLIADYQDIVVIYGKPVPYYEDNKIDVEWLVDTPYGIATIYNYKDGKAYLGDDGLDVAAIREWRVGGKHSKVLDHVKQQVQQHSG